MSRATHVSKIESKFNPQASGVGLAWLTMGEEDDLFFEKADYTRWAQSSEHYSPFHMASIYSNMNNTQVGQRMSAEILKSCDYLWKTYVLGYFPGILPNNSADQSVTQTSYVNAPLYFMIKQLFVKIGTHNIFDTTGLIMLVMCELNGLLKDLAELLGFNFTKTQLIKDSKETEFYVVH